MWRGSPTRVLARNLVLRSDVTIVDSAIRYNRPFQGQVMGKVYAGGAISPAGNFHSIQPSGGSYRTAPQFKLSSTTRKDHD